jgi:hypothetical protein
VDTFEWLAVGCAIVGVVGLGTLRLRLWRLPSGRLGRVVFYALLLLGAFGVGAYGAWLGWRHPLVFLVLVLLDVAVFIRRRRRPRIPT